MIADIVNGMGPYKGTYSDKVKAMMKTFRNKLTDDQSEIDSETEENPIVQYDYTSYCFKKRAEGTVLGVAEARKRLSDILPAAQLEAMFAYSNMMIMKGGYNCEVDRCNLTTLSAAIWMLDELLLSENIDDIYQYLPEYDENNYAENFYLPVNHPVYDDDLIFSLFYLIRHRNTSRTLGEDKAGTLVWEQPKADQDEKSLQYRSAFDSVIALLKPESVKEAVQHFEEKVWEFYRLSFSVMAAVEKRIKALLKERDDLQQQIIKPVADIKPRNILLMPNVNDNACRDPLFAFGRDFGEKQAEIRRLENEIDRLEQVTVTCLSLPNDREKLVKSLKGIISAELTEKMIAFHVDDPFETAFALLYLLDTNSRIPWYYYGSISVAYTMCDQLPYDIRLQMPKKAIKLSDWNSVLYRHRYKGYRFEKRSDASGEPVEREYAKNLSQLVFSNTLSFIPRVVPELEDLAKYFNNFGELTEREKEAYSLLSYALVASQLHRDSVNEYQAVQSLDKLLEESGEGESIPQGDDDRMLLQAENDRLRAKNRELVERVSGMLASRKAEALQVQLQQHQIELQEKELADLREAIYILENGSKDEATVDTAIRYPYTTTGKIISFGGHDAWLKEMRKKLPNVMFIAPDSLPNIDLIRNADAVWLQTNCLSHSDFFRVINIVRQNGIPLRYFSFAGSEKCAEQLVKSVN